MPEFTGVAVRFGRPPPAVILGHEQNDPCVDRELGAGARSPRCCTICARSRIGLMGHVLESMLDMHTDPTAITAAFGAHVVLVEPGEMLKYFLADDIAATEKWKQRILEFFDTPDPRSDPITEKLTDARPRGGRARRRGPGEVDRRKAAGRPRLLL